MASESPLVTVCINYKRQKYEVQVESVIADLLRSGDPATVKDVLSQLEVERLKSVPSSSQSHSQLQHCRDPDQTVNLQSDDGENVAGSSGKETMPAGSSLVKNANPGSTCQETAGHSSQGTPMYWSKDNASLLFQLRMEKDSLFQGVKAHSTLWSAIAKEMSGIIGLNITGEQCNNKFKSMKRAYIATVDHNKKTGSDPKTCPFFDEFNQILGSKASHHPQITMDSLAPTVAIASEESGSGLSDPSPPSTSPDTDDNSVRSSPPIKTKKSSQTSKVSQVQGKRKCPKDTIAHFFSEAEKRDKQNVELAEKMHSEKMVRFDRFLDIMAKLTDKQ